MLTRSLAAFLCSAAAVANVASADALLSNPDEDNGVGIVVASPADASTVGLAQAIRSQTGSNERGYNLTSVKAVLANASSSAGVRVWIFSSTAEGNPDSSLYTLSGAVVLPTTDQGPEDSARVSTFDAPANATLESNTRYFLVLDSRFSQLYRYYKVWGTKSDDISKVADGWSMNNYRHTGIRNSGVWTTADEVPFVEVTGSAVVPSSDATLTDLGLTWDDGGTGTDIALNPAFNASTTACTASVANAVDRITIAGIPCTVDRDIDGVESQLRANSGPFLSATEFKYHLPGYGVLVCWRAPGRSGGQIQGEREGQAEEPLNFRSGFR